MSREAALDHLANVFGFGPEPIDWNVENSFAFADNGRDLRGLIKDDEEVQLFEIGDAGDGIVLVFNKGMLMAAGYMSSRGSAFVAVGFDGKKFYLADTLSERWQVTEFQPDSVLDKLVMEGWNDVRDAMPERIPH